MIAGVLAALVITIAALGWVLAEDTSRAVPGPLKGVNDHDEHGWIEDLAAHVIRALESDPKQELPV